MIEVKQKAVQLDIQINGTSLSIDKKNLVSLQVKRIIGDSANTFSLEVFDETAYQVESLLADTKTYTKGDSLAEITIRYSAAEDLSKSIIFSGIILTYNVSFVGKATMLSLEGILSCAIDAKSTINWWFKKQSICWADPDVPETGENAVTYMEDDVMMVYPHKLFRRIIEEYAKVNGGADGINQSFKCGEVDDTIAVPISDVSTTQMNQTAAEYINQVLCPNAVYDLDGELVAGFDYIIDANGHNFKLSSLYEDTKPEKTYDLKFGEQNSVVISFSLSETGVMVMANTFKDENGELLASLASLDKKIGQTTLQNARNSGKSVEEVDNKVKLYNEDASLLKSSVKKIISSSSDKGLSVQLSSVWDKLKTFPFEATMTVWGEYSDAIKPGNYVSLVILDSNNKEHYASGTYYILEVTDDVSSSGFIQTLTLFKKSDEYMKSINGESDNESTSEGGIPYTPIRELPLADLSNFNPLIKPVTDDSKNNNPFFNRQSTIDRWK